MYLFEVIDGEFPWCVLYLAIDTLAGLNWWEWWWF